MTTKDILKLAKKAGLCREWQDDFRKDHTLKHLCEKYFEGSDWAMKNDFPSIEVLRKFKGFSDEYGIHTDYEGSIYPEKASEVNQFAFFGNSAVDIECSGYTVTEIYIRHNSKARISADENAFVIVNVLDSASVDIECSGSAQVNVSDYGKRTRVKADGNVKIFKADF